MKKIPVGVLGASGYAGRELCALLANHPGLELAFATANDQRGTTARLGGRPVTFVAPDDARLESAELVFSALPHGASATWVARTRTAGSRVVDLSSDLRPGAASPDLTIDAPYGLTELARGAVQGAEVVANPGCYATAVLLAVLPFVRRGLVASDRQVVINAASGVTGAGNNPKRELLFAEVAGDFRAYGVGNVHRHLLEMRAAVGAAGGEGIDLLFTPHLLPTARGILATIALPLTRPLADPMSVWREEYAGEPFIELADEPPALRDVNHRNVARLFAVAAQDVTQPTLLLFSAIDNLLKGAAGQAMQNANLMLGLDEPMGLPS
ncbi:MAG: N-acetyl-gamma-glutamyl-phosphate reductase [Gemmatimonadaceae bacterium]|nr:N-acetyl-gamma-glutamyl-phosphate reductase [Gemmatimonadaceae bacterium]